MTGVQEYLVADLIDLAERGYGVDFETVRAAVEQRLRPTRPLPAGLMDPRQAPSYWCVPLLVGDYISADPAAIAIDLERYVSGCVFRHLFHEEPRPPFAMVDDELETLVGRAYDACRAGGGTFPDKFAAKCQSWTVLLVFGTQEIASRPSEPGDYATAMSAIVAVYSCTQVLDDWHDRNDDLARGHWNMWTDEPAQLVLRAIDPLLRDATRAVGQLRHHPLRDALRAQLRDSAAELADLVAVSMHLPSLPARGAVEGGVTFLTRRLGAEGSGLWRDFSSPDVSAGSTECISAFIATLLAPIASARPVARLVASTLLAHARPSGGWGYREDVVEDVDSTAWVILAAAAAGVAAAPGLIERSSKYLLSHRRADGGFATYDHHERRQLSTVDLPDWSLSDTTVTCSTLLALAAIGDCDDHVVRSGCDFVAGRCTDGEWPSLWWRGTAYGTWLAVWVLTELGAGRYSRQCETARGHLLATRHVDGGWGGDVAPNAFDTALGLHTLCRLARPDNVGLVRESAAALAGWQGHTGRWQGGAQMLAPGAYPGSGLVLHDELLTTACAVSALQMVEHMSTDPTLHSPLARRR